MTKEKLAYLLNGREYGNEISLDEEKQAEDSGLIAIFGYSDDGVIFAGKARDQFGGWDGKSFKLNIQGSDIEVTEIDVRNVNVVNSLVGKDSDMVHAIWSPKEIKSSWLITSDIPHATFDIVEDGELFCRGIVIDTKDLTLCLGMATQKNSKIRSVIQYTSGWWSTSVIQQNMHRRMMNAILML